MKLALAARQRLRRAVSDLFRIIGGQIHRPVVASLVPETQEAVVRLYSLKDSSRVKPGYFESAACLSTPIVRNRNLFPHAAIISTHLFDGPTFRQAINVHKGAWLATPNTVRSRLIDAASIAIVDANWTFTDLAKVVDSTESISFSPSPSTAVHTPTFHTLEVHVADCALSARQRFANFLLKPPSAMDVPADIRAAVPLSRSREAWLHSTCSNVDENVALDALLPLLEGEGVAVDDVQVVGIYRRIPMAWVRQIELEYGGASLSVYLRSPRANMVQSGSQALFAIAFGRVRGQKGLIRALIPEKIN